MSNTHPPFLPLGILPECRGARHPIHPLRMNIGNIIYKYLCFSVIG